MAEFPLATGWVTWTCGPRTVAGGCLAATATDGVGAGVVEEGVVPEPLAAGCLIGTLLTGTCLGGAPPNWTCAGTGGYRAVSGDLVGAVRTGSSWYGLGEQGSQPRPRLQVLQ